jgi:hypothetical protein
MFPFAQDVLRFLIGLMHGKVGLCQVQIFALDLQRRHAAPITQHEGDRHVGILRDLLQGANRLFEGKILGDEIRLNHFEHHGGRTHFQQGGIFRHVGVGKGDMQTPVALFIGVRFIAQVNDTAFVGGRAGQLLADVWRALGEVE